METIHETINNQRRSSSALAVGTAAEPEPQYEAPCATALLMVYSVHAVGHAVPNFNYTEGEDTQMHSVSARCCSQVCAIWAQTGFHASVALQ